LPSSAREGRPSELDDDHLLQILANRLGRTHARQRLGIERDHQAQVFGQGLNFFHPENLPFAKQLIAGVLMASGFYWRGLRNARDVEVTRNLIASSRLPKEFDGYSILHLSDLHTDMSEAITERVARLVTDCEYDLCVMTGDYRAQTSGPHDAALAGMARIRGALRGPLYGVLGNHDSAAMVPALEALGIRLLMNERIAIERGDVHIQLAGVDDAHFFRMDNVEKVAADMPEADFSILLSHTPEIYRQAAHAGFDVMLSGHTHGGQICLPGGIPITLDSILPRRLGSGTWRHASMTGYTSRGAGCSIIPVRFNCRPEVTLHQLKSS
jgi:predicted MPP superfamily phosphohydrolase